MIWLYILAAIVAQAIVVVLIVEYINRRSMPGEASNVETTSSEVEQKEPLPTEKKEEEAVGESSFSYEAFKAMQEDIRSLRECVETLMDAKDAEFDEPDTEKKESKEEVPDARMSREAEAKAWEDNRDEIVRLEKEDDTVAYPNELATGADFDSITKATVILETADGRTPEDLQFAMKIYRTLEGTQFSGCLPDALLEKLIECHRRFDLKINVSEDKNDEEAISPFVEIKPQSQEKIEEEMKAKFEELAKSPDSETTPRFNMDFVRKHPRNK